MKIPEFGDRARRDEDFDPDPREAAAWAAELRELMVSGPPPYSDGEAAYIAYRVRYGDLYTRLRVGGWHPERGVDAAWNPGLTREQVEFTRRNIPWTDREINLR